MKRFNIARKYGAKIAAGASIFVLGTSQAFAVLPAEATAALTALETDGAAMVAEGWPVLVAVLVPLILMKLFKKTASKAT